MRCRWCCAATFRHLPPPPKLRRCRSMIRSRHSALARADEAFITSGASPRFAHLRARFDCGRRRETLVTRMPSGSNGTCAMRRCRRRLACLLARGDRLYLCASNARRRTTMAKKLYDIRRQQPLTPALSRCDTSKTEVSGVYF